jgi:hypothetical protein
MTALPAVSCFSYLAATHTLNVEAYPRIDYGTDILSTEHFLAGDGPLPAIEATRDQTGDWDHVGPTRTIEFTDGSTAHEEITDYERPRYFAYEVSGFTNSLRVLVQGARGEWWFSPGFDGSTEIRWRYTFKPRGVARPIVALLVARFWRGYARKALALAVAEAERGPSP